MPLKWTSSHPEMHLRHGHCERKCISAVIEASVTAAFESRTISNLPCSRQCA